MKGGAHAETASPENKYNQNFSNRFCGCGELYDAHEEKGTMYQCLGLGAAEDGGCGEDWWHPECIVGLPRGWYKDSRKGESKEEHATTVANGVGDTDDEHEDPPQPPGFPHEDDFESFICYQCVETSPWIKRYAGTTGFLPAIYYRKSANVPEGLGKRSASEKLLNSNPTSPLQIVEKVSRKRKAESDTEDIDEPCLTKKHKTADEGIPDALLAAKRCQYDTLPPAPAGELSLFLREDFRDHFCRCQDCFPKLGKHQQLLEEEEVYEPPLSESGDGEAGGGSVGTGSLLDRGEAALSNVDRVRAIGKSCCQSLDQVLC